MRGATFTLPLSGDRPDAGLGLDRCLNDILT